jgi:phage terminase large subunit-like protein
MSDGYSDEDKRLIAEIQKALDRRKLEFYKPYPKQRLFHDLGAQNPGLVNERLLMAGNQLGKTLSAGAETAMHMTGDYPKWWKGRRFDGPVNGWVAGSTSQTTRDNPQRLLLGPVGEWGTGYIPGNAIVDIKKAIHGVSEAVETLLVRHRPTGKISRATFKTYDQGRERWQGETLDFVWCDEEPPLDIYSEGKTRLNVKAGLMYITFTPLLGMSEVVLRFIKEKPPGSHVVQMTIHEALHYTKEQREAIIAGYPEHEREARAEGIPMLGSGAVFPIHERMLKEGVIQIPGFWPRICGMDIGWDHPTAAVWIAWDRDADIIHVYDVYKLEKQTPIVHAAAIKARGHWIPVAWPHDALQHDKGSGDAIANQYRKLGVRMLMNHATHPAQKGKKEGTGGYSLEAGIQDMLQRMQTGRLKVADHLNDWFEEYRLYHRKDGLIVKEHDDLMSATRVACMMLRHARVAQAMSSTPPLAPFEPSDFSMGVLG